MTRTPGWLMQLYPRRIWRMPAAGRKVYLTFDDGPTPGVTDRLLDQLAGYGAKATFFCVGARVARFPGLVRRQLAEGHTIGNHTQHHRNGWQTPTADYLDDVWQADEAFRAAVGDHPRLFRPPYGKAGRRSARALARHYRLVMWDVMPGDFYPDHDAPKVAQLVCRYVQPGSVVVLHDSPKYGAKMLDALPEILAYLRQQGFEMAALPDADFKAPRQT
ncbi:MAG: polysaccharide deacetylase family protein [Bacteroidota bacterium]